MRSMTGCGSGRIRQDGWDITVEIKTVNHRFLDLSLRLPRNISFLESVVREKITSVLKRGHVDVFITVLNTEESSKEIKVDRELAQHYFEAAKTLCEATGAQNDLNVATVLALDGVVTISEKEMDQDIISALCGKATEEALEQLVSMRILEGSHLREDLYSHLNLAETLREKILVHAPEVVSEYREKLDARIRTAVQEGIDPMRLAQEVALMADRCAVDEELSRLESHIQQMKVYLQAEDETGKKMDFLIQEMNRETNTIGSKAQDAEIAKYVVDLKSEIEKMREQIQNVE